MYSLFEAKQEDTHTMSLSIHYYLNRTCDNDTTELSSFTASSTIKRFGRSLRLRIAVAKSSLMLGVERKLLKFSKWQERRA